MRYYKDVDYFIYRFPIPHALPGYIVRNSDDTVNICVNDDLAPERQDRTLRHELRHLALEHFWDKVLTIEEIELEADEIDDGQVRYGRGYSWVERVNEYVIDPELGIPVFDDGDAYLRYFVRHATPKQLELLKAAGWKG